jgi:hypothetical protein
VKLAEVLVLHTDSGLFVCLSLSVHIRNKSKQFSNLGSGRKTILSMKFCTVS